MPPFRFIAQTFFISWAALGSPGSLFAQVTEETDSLRQQYRLPVPTAEQAAGIIVSPNASFTPGPTSYQSDPFLLFFVGAAYTPRTRYVEGKHDGNGLLGMAFGDPQKWVGVQADLGLYSTARSGLFNRMGLSLGVYRFLPGDLVLSVGWENILNKGDPDTGESQYGVLSRWFPLKQPDQWFNSIGLSIGLGNGVYSTETNWINNDTTDFNLFGSVSVQVAWPVALVANWLGDDLMLGAAITPFKQLPLVISPAVYDVTGQVETGATFMISALYAIQVK